MATKEKAQFVIDREARVTLTQRDFAHFTKA
jgi:uncharacterized protein (DUF1778 family)